MDHQYAKKLARLIATHASVAGSDFRVVEKISNRELSGFHQWADARPHEGAFLVQSLSKEALWLLLVDWNRSNDYYAILFPKSKSGPIAEIHELTDDDGELVLHWTYAPRKHDGKNAERRAYFAEAFLTEDVTISVPTEANQVDDFFVELFSLAECRLKADALDDNKPTERFGFPEGKLKERLHFSRERNSEVVRRAKAEAAHLRCACCNFDFQARYGETGKGYIEAHHLKPVSELHHAGEETCIEDLALVCSNCHRMLHRKRPWLGINELKRLLE